MAAFRRYGDEGMCPENPTHGQMVGWSDGSENHPETQGRYCRSCYVIEEAMDRAAEYDHQVTVESVAFVRPSPEWTI